MKKPGFVGLGMERSRSGTCAGRHANHHICILPPAVVDLSKVVYDLVEAYTHKVGKLHFHHGLVAFDRKAKPCANDGTFAKRGIAYAISSKLRFEPIRDFKYTSVLADVLPHEYQVGVLFHGLPQAIADRIDESLFCGGSTWIHDGLGKGRIDIL